MARVAKFFEALNDEIIIKDVDEYNGAASIQYATGGTGTLVLEQSNMDDGADPAVDIWSLVATVDVSTGSATPVLSIAAAGLIRGEIVGARKVRCRMSVVGTVRASLTLNNC